MTYPNDADGDALRRLADSGADMTKPMTIDFFVAVPTARTGEVVANGASALGFATSVEQDKESGDWTCYCSKRMVATYDSVVGAQAELEGVSSRIPGTALDGWGSFGE